MCTLYGYTICVLLTALYGQYNNLIELLYTKLLFKYPYNLTDMTRSYIK